MSFFFFKFQSPISGQDQTGTGVSNPFLPHTAKKRSRQPRTIRGLIELTGDPLIFAKLHMWFTWILRMSSCQISEELVHGPLSEDTQVKMERERQFEEFVKLGSLGCKSDMVSAGLVGRVVRVRQDVSHPRGGRVEGESRVSQH